MTGESLRDARDAIQAKMERLTEEQETLRRFASQIDAAGGSHDRIDARIDAISDELAALEAELDDADDDVARHDPERGIWGHDGL